MERPTLAPHAGPAAKACWSATPSPKKEPWQLAEPGLPDRAPSHPVLFGADGAALITSILLRFVGAVESRNRRQEPDEGTGLGLTLTQCERQALIVSLEEYAHRATARLRAVARRAPARA